MLDLYLESVPEPLAELLSRDASLSASAERNVRQLRAARGSGTLPPDDADAVTERLHTMRVEDVLVVRRRAAPAPGAP